MLLVGDRVGDLGGGGIAVPVGAGPNVAPGWAAGNVGEGAADNVGEAGA